MDAQVQRTQEKFKALPLQVIETDRGVILRRGCLHLKIQGEGTAKAVSHMLSVFSSTGETLESLTSHFEVPDRPNIERLIQRLLDKKFFIPIGEKSTFPQELKETPLDVFYWHFGEITQHATQQLNTMPMVIMGVNLISQQLIQTFHASHMTNFQIVDHPLLRNPCLFDDNGEIAKSERETPWRPILSLEEWEFKQPGSPPRTLIVTSDIGPSLTFHNLNRRCVEIHDHLFPVWLEDMVGYVGPLIIPGESACFECTRGRMNSHAADPKSQDLINQAEDSGGSPVGFHPAMVSILGSVAAFELMKFYSHLFSNSVLGRMIEVSLLGPRLQSRKVFKLPRCPVCSPLHSTPSMTPKLDVCLEPK